MRKRRALDGDSKPYTEKKTQFFLLVLGSSLHHVATDLLHSIHQELYFSHNKTKPQKINFKGKVIRRKKVSQYRGSMPMPLLSASRTVSFEFTKLEPTKLPLFGIHFIV